MLMLATEKHAALVTLGWTPHPVGVENSILMAYRTLYRSPDGTTDLPVQEAYRASGHVAKPTHAIEWRKGEGDFKRLAIDGEPYEGTLGAMESAMEGSLNAPMYTDVTPGDPGAITHPLYGCVKLVRPEYRIVPL